MTDGKVDISRSLILAANCYAGATADLLEAAASEIDLLRDEKADRDKIIAALRALLGEGDMVENLTRMKSLWEAQNSDNAEENKALRFQKHANWELCCKMENERDEARREVEAAGQRGYAEGLEAADKIVTGYLEDEDSTDGLGMYEVLESVGRSIRAASPAAEPVCEWQIDRDKPQTAGRFPYKAACGHYDFYKNPTGCCVCGKPLRVRGEG
jgi:hypothetical protein